MKSRRLRLPPARRQTKRRLQGQTEGRVQQAAFNSFMMLHQLFLLAFIQPLFVLHRLQFDSFPSSLLRPRCFSLSVGLVLTFRSFASLPLNSDTASEDFHSCLKALLRFPALHRSSFFTYALCKYLFSPLHLRSCSHSSLISITLIELCLHFLFLSLFTSPSILYIVFST